DGKVSSARTGSAATSSASIANRWRSRISSGFRCPDQSNASKRCMTGKSDQLGLEAHGERLQLREEACMHRLERRVLPVHADVERCDGLAVETLERHRDRAEADLDLLVDDGVAGLAHLKNGFAKVALVGDGVFGEFFRLHARKESIEGLVVEAREQH